MTPERIRAGMVFRTTRGGPLRPDTLIVDTVRPPEAALVRYRPGRRGTDRVVVSLDVLCDPEAYVLVRQQAQARDIRAVGG